MIYAQIKKLTKKGHSQRQIAKDLNLSRNTVSKYLDLDSDEMAIWLASTKTRKRKLDEHHQLILDWLRQYPDMSSAQVYDWLEERHLNCACESSVRKYVNDMRQLYNIPKIKKARDYEAIPELPMGYQAQVDFGEIRVQKSSGGKIKLYVVAFVLSHSRYKYMVWQDRPFRTVDLINVHQQAFTYFGGKPREIVYDQDSIIVVSENSGDIVFTQPFDAYRQTEPFQVYMCRGADPESKGKIENVIGFIKNNFAKNRIFYDLYRWNQDALQWLVRRGNGKQHNATKKVPLLVFEEEQKYLLPDKFKRLKTNEHTRISTRTVRKDNTVMYAANRYSVPLGTFTTRGIDVELYEVEGILKIMNTETGELIARHEVSPLKGVLVQDRAHTRDRTIGLDEMSQRVMECFNDQPLAKEFVSQISRRYPRYRRDQFQSILNFASAHDGDELTTTLEYCLSMSLFSATEFKDAHEYLYYMPNVVEEEDIYIPDGLVSAETQRKLSLIETETRNLDIYTKMMEV